MLRLGALVAISGALVRSYGATEAKVTVPVAAAPQALVRLERPRLSAAELQSRSEVARPLGLGFRV